MRLLWYLPPALVFTLCIYGKTIPVSHIGVPYRYISVSPMGISGKSKRMKTKPEKTHNACFVAPVSYIGTSLRELMSVSYIGISYRHALKVSAIGISLLYLRWIPNIGISKRYPLLICAIGTTSPYSIPVPRPGIVYRYVVSVHHTGTGASLR